MGRRASPSSPSGPKEEERARRGLDAASASSSASEFYVVLSKSVGGKIGLKIDEKEEHLLITKVKEGLIQEWNLAHPDLVVCTGDRITEVNGVRGDSSRMFEVLSQDLEVRMTISHSA